MRKILSSIFILALLISNGCVPPQEEVLTEINLQVQDSLLQRVYDFQDKAQIDSLITFFNHADPSYRYASAMAMGSIRDSKAIPTLGQLLGDPVEEVRQAAAYAIGQIGSPEGETVLINNFDTLAYFNNANGSILEAVGRCGTKQSLGFLSVTDYSTQDTAVINGQAYGIYRFATRGITLPEGTKKMITLVNDKTSPLPARVMAANYLYRAKDVLLDSLQTKTVANLLETAEDPRIRMTLAIALGKTKRPEALRALTSQFAKEQDYRVKCNILRALGNFPYPEMQGLFFEMLKNSNTKIARTAANFFVNHGEARDATVYWRRARELNNGPVKTTMYKAANRHMPATFEEYKWLINNDLKTMVRDSTINVYQRADALRALSEYAWNYKFFYNQILQQDNPVLQTAAAEGLGRIANHPDFDRIFNVGKRRVMRELSVYFADLMTKGDAGVQAIVAGILSDKNGLKEEYENSSFLHLAKRSLELPKETETLYAIEKAIAYFDDGTYENKQPDYNHPIDWTLLKSVTESSKATIQTNKGTIKIQFYPLDAPASVANFIKLSKDGFYDGKAIHRVVPNFVMQAGCPRGDGYGGLDYTIRTEVTMRRYDQEGYVGMASAGPNTEGTQWFITHSPTPHLDGNYTIFAKVTNGMNVVHQIEVGDRIESINIEK